MSLPCDELTEGRRRGAWRTDFKGAAGTPRRPYVRQRRAEKVEPMIETENASLFVVVIRERVDSSRDGGRAGEVSIVIDVELGEEFSSF